MKRKWPGASQRVSETPGRVPVQGGKSGRMGNGEFRRAGEVALAMLEEIKRKRMR